MLHLPGLTIRTLGIALPKVMATTLEHRGIELTVSKSSDGRWLVRVGSHVHTARFLDQALDAALPTLTPTERESFVASVLAREFGPTSQSDAG